MKKTKGFFLVKLLIVVCLIMGVAFIYISPIGQRVRLVLTSGYNIILQKANWKLDNVIVVGHKRTEIKEIIETLNIQQNQAMNTIDLDEKKKQLETLPWVKKVVIERHLPQKLVIQIEEKTPIARWQNQGQYYLIDEQGKTISDPRYILEDLILVVGSDAPEHILELLTALDQFPDILEKVRSARRIENRRWNISLFDAEKGLEIMLPQKQIVAALSRLEAQNQQSKLLKKDIGSIDIRLDDRIIVHPKKVKTKKGKK